MYGGLKVGLGAMSSRMFERNRPEGFRPTDPRFVYVALVGEHYKVGSAKDVPARMRGLASSERALLTLLRSHRLDRWHAFMLENIVRDRLPHLRVRLPAREWYRADPLVLETTDEVAGLMVPHVEKARRRKATPIDPTNPHAHPFRDHPGQDFL